MHACTSAYALIAESVVCISTGVVCTMYVQVCTLNRCCEHQSTHLLIHLLQDVHMHSCLCSLFIALGNEDGGVQLVYEINCCLACWVVFDRRRDRGVVCVFFIFNAGGSVCVCMCVYTHTYTHTAQMGYSNVSPGVGMRHLEGPKNPDGLNLGIYIFVYVCKVHMCMYMRGGMRSWTNCFFHVYIYVYIYSYAYIQIYIYTCKCVYIYT